MATILSINNNIDAGLRALGHEVYSVHITEHGYYCAASYIEQCPTKPDIFFQKESLGTKVFFTDVHTLTCQTAFWGIDSHLRYSWQRFYAALFDVFFTPHKAFLERLPQEWLHPQMHRLAQCGQERPFTPHATREHDLNFVGRLSGTRTQRKKLCQLLSTRYGVQHIDNIAFSKMLDVYCNTRIAPNESIANETNFRLLESASCGCAIITPDIGEDQNCLFEPGHEILTYTSLESLAEHIEHCLGDTSFAEKIARNAWERVQGEHLPLHRAQEVMRIMEKCASEPPENNAESPYMPSRRHKENAEDMQKFALAFIHLSEVLPIANFKAVCAQHFHTPALRTLLQLVTLLTDIKNKKSSFETAKEHLYALLEQANLFLLQPHTSAPYKKMLAVAAGGIALQYDDAPRSSFYLHLYEKMAHPAQAHSIKQHLQGTTNSLDVALNWACILKRDSKQCFGGMTYISGYCQTALDFSSLCQEAAPQDMRWAAILATLDHVLALYSYETRQELCQLSHDI